METTLTAHHALNFSWWCTSDYLPLCFVASRSPAWRVLFSFMHDVLLAFSFIVRVSPSRLQASRPALTSRMPSPPIFWTSYEPPARLGSPRSYQGLVGIELALSRDYEVQRLFLQLWDCVPSPTVRLYGLAKLHDQPASASYSLSSSCIYKL